MTPSGAVITGWGSALPDTVVTNADLEARLDTSDQWIVERSGIRERRVGGTVSGLATQAGHKALERAGVSGSDIDLLVLATCTPDLIVPATSAAVHHALARRVLLVGADCLSLITDPDDRGTAVLFADGAAAVVLEASDADGDGLLSVDMGVDGSAHDLLTCPHGGTMHMEGKEVFRRAVRITVESASSALERAKLVPDDVALFVPHQANLRIIEAAASRLGLPMERVAVVLERTGNTSSASVPLALAAAADAGRLAPGDHVLLSGFGAGMTWASAVLRWGVDT
ncbi:MAG: 3-oxoacyl-[acyl-carrier-protein] synthase III C-terminal domain-containing protein [Acidimicrobiales bacterium]